MLSASLTFNENVNHHVQKVTVKCSIENLIFVSGNNISKLWKLLRDSSLCLLCNMHDTGQFAFVVALFGLKRERCTTRPFLQTRILAVYSGGDKEVHHFICCLTSRASRLHLKSNITSRQWISFSLVLFPCHSSLFTLASVFHCLPWSLVLLSISYPSVSPSIDRFVSKSWPVQATKLCRIVVTFAFNLSCASFRLLQLSHFYKPFYSSILPSLPF